MRHNIRSSILVLGLVIAASAGITDAAAKGGSQLLPSQSLYNTINPDASRDEIKALCAEIVAREDA